MDGQAQGYMAGGRRGAWGFDDSVFHVGIPVAGRGRKGGDFGGDRASIGPGTGQRLFAGPIGNQEDEGADEEQVAGLSDGIVERDGEDGRAGGLRQCGDAKEQESFHAWTSL